MDDQLPFLLSDPVKLHQIVSNLVDNALKYSPPGSTVTIRGVRRGSDVVVLVQDDGGGIPPEQQDRIFDRFYQVDQSSTRSVGGTGLGLYICRKLADALGGSLTLERSDESGSVFAVSIPYRPGDKPLAAGTNGAPVAVGAGRLIP